MSREITILTVLGLGLKQGRIERLREEYEFEAESSTRPVLRVYLWRVFASYLRFQNLNTASFFLLGLLSTWFVLGRNNFPLVGLMFLLLFTYELEREYNLAERLFEIARKTLFILTGLLVLLQLQIGVEQGSDFVAVNALPDEAILVITLVIAGPALAAFVALFIRIANKRAPLANLSRVIYLGATTYLFYESLQANYFAGARVWLTLGIVIPSITVIALLNIKRKPALA
jgi:hypothetical protein